MEAHGTKDNWIKVSADDILGAIAERHIVNIRYAIIEGDLDITKIADRLDRDKDNKLTINKGILMWGIVLNGIAFFRSINFTDRICFISTLFSNNAIFSKATFSDEVRFDLSNFSSIAEFDLTTFNDNAYFNSSTFNNNVYFDHATFNCNANFQSANFNYCAGFEGARFNGSVNLKQANLKLIQPMFLSDIGRAYRKSSLSGSGYFFQLSGIDWFHQGEYDNATSCFHSAMVEYRKEGEYDEVSNMYVMEKKSIKMVSTTDKKILYQLWETSCNYGESWLRFTLWLLGIVVIFAIVYTPSPWGIIAFSNNPYQLDNNLLDKIHTSLYLSISTFASFGNLEPVNNIGKFAVSFELLLGYVMFGILITLVARKMTRS